MRRPLPALILASLGCVSLAHAQDAKKVLYPSMAPIEQYLMNRGAKIALAESAAPAFTDPEFWNPNTRGAICYNPRAARTVVPPLLKRQEWVPAELSKAQVIDSIKVAFAKGIQRAPAPGSMSYMMAKGARLSNAGNLAHVMFFDHEPVLIVPTSIWSDGSSAISGRHFPNLMR